MNWEIDHVFLATTEAEPCEKALVRCGLIFDHRVVHRGQGTANACAFFANAYVEILRAEDWNELRSDVVQPLCLDERIRWRETGACPFGVCLRSAHTGSTPMFPKPTWNYEARYRPIEECIPIVTPRNSESEPMVFLSRTARPGWRGLNPGELTSVRIRLPRTEPLSEGVAWCREEGLVEIVQDEEHLIELEWDDGRSGLTERLLPDFPIVLRR